MRRTAIHRSFIALKSHHYLIAIISLNGMVSSWCSNYLSQSRFIQTFIGAESPSFFFILHIGTFFLNYFSSVKLSRICPFWANARLLHRCHERLLSLYCVKNLAFSNYRLVKVVAVTLVADSRFVNCKYLLIGLRQHPCTWSNLKYAYFTGFHREVFKSSVVR